LDSIAWPLLASIALLNMALAHSLAMIAGKSCSPRALIFLLTQCLSYLSWFGLACFSPLRKSVSALLSIFEGLDSREAIKVRPRVQIRTGESKMDFRSFTLSFLTEIIALPQRATIFRNRTTQALGALACMILSFLTLPAKTAGTSGPPPETLSWFLSLEPPVIALSSCLLA
jgi:hypothetical protein